MSYPPASAVVNGHEVRPHPQLADRGFYQTLEHPEVGEVDCPRLPMRLSGLGKQAFSSAAPTLGEHNEEVLVGELGMSEEEYADLVDDQIIGIRPSFL